MVDIYNFALISFILYYILVFNKKIIQENEIKILILIHFSCIFIIDVTLTTLSNTDISSYFPDQNKYTSGVLLVREMGMDIINYNWEQYNYLGTSDNTYAGENQALKGAVLKTSFFYSLWPFLFDYGSNHLPIIYINYILFLVIYIFITNKYEISLSSKIGYFLIPSLLIFHCLALKDFPLFFSFFFFSYFFYRKKYFICLFALLLIFLFRDNLFYFSLLFFILSISFNFLYKISSILAFILISLACLLFIYTNYETLLSALNQFRSNFYRENYVYNFVLFENSFQILKYLILNIFDTILILRPKNIFQYINVIENVIIYSSIVILYIRYNCYRSINLNLLILFFLTMLILICLTISNYGAIDRYKFPIEFSILLLIIIHSSKRIKT